MACEEFAGTQDRCNRQQSVVLDLFGVTGRNLIDLICSRKKITLEEVKRCVRGNLKDTVEELYQSIQGFFDFHHRFEMTMLIIKKPSRKVSGF
ncbi:MAG: hypothetical protein MRJ65_02555 [Candidatus Brocadiaceae bacterium]|nr:hypothetical protein [Candidatus Brocadiaceae bacterium]